MGFGASELELNWKCFSSPTSQIIFMVRICVNGGSSLKAFRKKRSVVISINYRLIERRQGRDHFSIYGIMES